MEAAKEDGKTRKWGGKIPPNLKLPLRDGDIDRPDDENYQEHFFVNASSKDAPQVVDRHVQPVTDPMMVYSGCYCNVSVNFYAFNANGNRGVAAGLGNVQFVCCEGGGVLMIEKLNERITIEKSTVVTDKVGNHRNTWEEYFTCFAYASTYQAQEDEGEVTAEQKSVVFTVRWCSETRGLTSTGYRIRFREQLYNIESVDPMNYQKKILKIHCRLERRQPDEQNRQHR